MYKISNGYAAQYGTVEPILIGVFEAQFSLPFSAYAKTSLCLFNKLF
jgi:hypothetical protein